MASFLATAGLQGWSCGRWQQTGPLTWEEQKLDGSQARFPFEVVDGPRVEGSTTLRLRCGGTDVIMTGGTIQVFSQGNYLGEYIGHWEQGSAPAQPPLPPMQQRDSIQSVQAPGPRGSIQSVPPQPPARGSVVAQEDQGEGMKSAPPRPPPAGQPPTFEVEEVSEQKGAPPARQSFAAAPPPRQSVSGEPADDGFMKSAPPQQAPGAPAQQAAQAQQAAPMPTVLPVTLKLYMQGIDLASLKGDVTLYPQVEATIRGAIAYVLQENQVSGVTFVESDNSVFARVGLAATSGDNIALYSKVQSSEATISRTCTHAVAQLPGMQEVCNGEILVSVMDSKGPRPPPSTPSASTKLKKSMPTPAPETKLRPKKPANLQATKEVGDALIAAAKRGDANKLRTMLAAGSDPDAFGSGGSEGGTAIFYAAEGGHKEAVQVLIEFLADVNLQAKGLTPMQGAFQKGHKDVLQVLFAATFQTLDHSVTHSSNPGLNAPPGGDGWYDEDDLPPGADDELREATKRLAAFGHGKEITERDKQFKLPSPEECESAQDAAVKNALASIANLN